MASGRASCGFLDSARQSAATTLSRRVRGVLSRGPEERSRVSLMCWGRSRPFTKHSSPVVNSEAGVLCCCLRL